MVSAFEGFHCNLKRSGSMQCINSFCRFWMGIILPPQTSTSPSSRICPVKEEWRASSRSQGESTCMPTLCSVLVPQTDPDASTLERAVAKRGVNIATEIVCVAKNARIWRKSHENCHQNLFWTYKALYCCSKYLYGLKSSYTSHRYCINSTFRCLVHNAFGWSGEACPLPHHQSKPGPFLGFPNAYAKRISHIEYLQCARAQGVYAW